MKYRQCSVSYRIDHACTGDATHGQYDSDPKVCAAYAEAHKKLHPHVADSWRECGKFELSRSPGPSIRDERREEWEQEQRAEEKRGKE